MKGVILLILFCHAASMISQETLTESNLKNRNIEILNHIKCDLNQDIDSISNLSIYTVPVSEMVIDSNRKINLLLDTIAGYAVLQSKGKTVGYAYKYTQEYPYKLRMIKNDTTIYMGGNLIYLLDNVALQYSSNPFRINIFSSKNSALLRKNMFVGFGFFKDGKLQFIGLANAKPILFDNMEDFFLFRFQSIDNFLKLKIENEN